MKSFQRKTFTAVNTIQQFFENYLFLEENTLFPNFLHKLITQEHSRQPLEQHKNKREHHKPIAVLFYIRVHCYFTVERHAHRRETDPLWQWHENLKKQIRLFRSIFLQHSFLLFSLSVCAIQATIFLWQSSSHCDRFGCALYVFLRVFFHHSFILFLCVCKTPTLLWSVKPISSPK